MRPQAGHVVHAGVGDARGIEAFENLRGAQIPKHRQDQRLQFRAVFVAPRIRCETRVGGQRGVVQHRLAEGAPLALVLKTQHHRAAVACLEGAVGVNAGVRGARARRRRCPFERVIHRVAHPFGQRFEHRHVDRAAPPGAGPQQQGRQDAVAGALAGRDVGHRNAGFGRRLGRARDRQKAGLALDQQVVGLLVTVRAVVTVARDVADDQARVVVLERVERQAHARGGARRQVLHQHVGARQQVHQRGMGVRVLEVQRKAFLGSVGPDEVRGQALDAGVVGSGKVAGARTLDLDDPRAQVGQLAAAQRGSDRVFEGDDGDAVEGAGIGHGGVVVVRSGRVTRSAW